MVKSSVEFRKKLKKAASIALTSAIVLSSSNVSVVFANEVEAENQEQAIEALNEDPTVTISDLKVQPDGDGRILVGFGIDKEIDLTNMLDNADDVIIKLTTIKGDTITKKKFSYDNYLNAEDGTQYGRFEKVPAGYYTTVFSDTKTGKLDGIAVDDVKVELTVKNDNVASTEVFYGENMKPVAPSVPEETKLVEVTTNAPDQVLVKFDLSEELDLTSQSQDNIIIKAIDKNTGQVLTTKNKTWSDYINDEKNQKFGRGDKVPAGTYSTVFSNTQLEYITLDGVAIELEINKDGQELLKTVHGEISNNKPESVQISNVSVNRNMEEHVSLVFDINQAINLELKATDNIEIAAINKNTGETLVTKNKTWSGYLNDANGNKYGSGSVLNAGTYSTTFKPSDLRYTAPQDIVIEISVTNNDIKVTHTDGEIVENPQVPERVVTISNLTSTQQGSGALVEFEIDQVMDLKLNSKDDLVITAIDQETGDILSSKNKTWSGYLNDIDGNKFGLNSIIRAGKYATVFNESQLRNVDPANIIIEVKAIKDGNTYTSTTGEMPQSEKVTISDVVVENFEQEDVVVKFAIDKNINLKLTSKDNIIINAIDQKTGQVIKSKNKTWSDYLNNEVGEQFGRGEVVEAGMYSNKFTKKQLGDRSIDEVIFEIVVKRDDQTTIYRTGKLESGFVDLESQEHWANDDIAMFAAKGYINGYDDGTFNPNGTITRAEFVKIVNRVFGFTEKADDNFEDVHEGAWYYDEIAIAKKAGYINGRGDNKFEPQSQLTREEAAKIVATILNIKGDGNLDNFADSNQISDWATEYVDALSDSSIMNGFDDGNFEPKSSVTRAQAVAILNRSEQLKK